MEERACPSCGAQNPVAAEYCWQCFARFTGPPPGTAQGAPARGSALAAAIGTGPGAGTPSAVVTEPATMTRWQPQTPTGDRVAGWAVKALVVILAAVVGLIGYRWLTRGLELPEQVGGQPRMEGELVEGFQDLLDSVTGTFDVEVDMELYGRGFPTYLLMAAEVPDGQGVAGFYQGFVAGAGTSAGIVDPNVVTCLGMPDGAGAQCSWVIEETVLLLQGFTTTEDDLAAVAEGVRSDLA
ncbi:MAG: DUF7577 domain-containing protein [Actinomycetota bacterium]